LGDLKIPLLISAERKGGVAQVVEFSPSSNARPWVQSPVLQNKKLK
jgi:hypothetical protein